MKASRDTVAWLKWMQRQHFNERYEYPFWVMNRWMRKAFIAGRKSKVSELTSDWEKKVADKIYGKGKT